MIHTQLLSVFSVFAATLPLTLSAKYVIPYFN